MDALGPQCVPRLPRGVRLSYDQAREHYRKGMRLYDVGRFDEVIKEFEAAYQYQDRPVTIFNLAQAYRRAGNNAKALELYRTYLRKAPNAPDRGEVEERIAALERAMAEVQDRVAQRK